MFQAVLITTAYGRLLWGFAMSPVAGAFVTLLVTRLYLPVHTESTNAYGGGAGPLISQECKFDVFLLPSKSLHSQLHTFMVMYRAHCQRILDSVARANFSDVSTSYIRTYQEYI